MSVTYKLGILRGLLACAGAVAGVAGAATVSAVMSAPTEGSGAMAAAVPAQTLHWSPMPSPLEGQLAEFDDGSASAELNGKLYVLGGLSRDRYRTLSDARSYDPATNTWTTLAPMQHPRMYFGAAAVNGKLYAIGGQQMYGGPPEMTVEEYDPATNVWTDKAPLPGSVGLDSMATVVVGSKIYLLGGNATGQPSVQFFDQASSQILVYDPAADSWTEGPDLPVELGAMPRPHAVGLNNHIYLLGGFAVRGYGDWGYLDTIWDLDLSTGSWTHRTTRPQQPRAHMGVAVRDGLIYLVGGYLLSTGDATASVEIFDPVTNAWSAAPDLAHPRYYLNATAVGQRIYAVGVRWDQPGSGTNVDDVVEVLLDKVEAPPCLVGKYLASSSDTACTLAPPGSFVGSVGATAPTPCAPGSYSDWFGAIQCTLAPYGTFVNGEGATAPTPASETAAGSYLSSNIEGATLIPCAPGSYADTPGLFECIPAPRGSFVSGSGATAPTPCPPGTGSGIAGAVACFPVPPDHSLQFSGGQAVQLNDVGPVRTVAAWVKRAQDGGGPIVSQWGAAPASNTPFPSSTFQFTVEVATNGQVHASLRNYRGPAIATLVSSSTIDPDTWTHVAVVFEDPNTVTIYINGTADSSVTLPLTLSSKFFPAGVSSARVLVGAADTMPPGGDQFFDGQITDVKIYSGPIVPVSLPFDCYAEVYVPLNEGGGDTVGVTSASGAATSQLIGDPLTGALPVWVLDGPDAIRDCRVDSTLPVIAADDITVTATDPAGVQVTYAPTASDDSGSVTVACSPASSATFTIGAHDVTCTATDFFINTASVTFSVTVVDGVPPVITALVLAPVEATSSGGAVVTFSPSATDNVPGPVTVTCSAASGSLFAIGTTPVSCTATDAAGNVSLPTNFDVVVRDATPPVLTVPANATIAATSPTGAVFTFTASAIDQVAGSTLVTCAPAAGTSFPVGTTTVACTTSDVYGNTASGGFTVTVLSATEMTATLLTTVQVEFPTAAGLLQNAMKQGTDTPAGCNTLAAFQSMVSAQSGKKLTASGAASLLSAAAAVRAAAGCR